MSLFSSLLKEYTILSGKTIYQLAKESGINRTSLQKSISENRVLSKELFLKLLPYLKLTIAEKEKLKEAYEIINCGETTYVRRRNIKNLIESIVSSYESVKYALKAEYSSIVDFTLPDTKLYSGAQNIQLLLKSLICKQISQNFSSDLYIFMPYGTEIINQIFTEIHQKDFNKITVTQLISFPKSNSNLDEDINLSLFSNILPYVLIKDFPYKIHVFYHNQLPEPDFSSYFPNFILFSDSLLQLTSNLDTAWLEQDSNIVSHYKERFECQIEHTPPLTRYYANHLELLHHYAEIEANISSLSWIEFQPCFLLFCSPALTDAVLYPEIPCRDQICSLMEKRFQQFQTIDNLIGIFNKHSLFHFVETGILYNIPPDIARPFTPEERFLLLNQLYQACDSGRQTIRAINPLSFPVSKHMSLSVHDNQFMTILIFDPDTNTYRITELTETTLIDSFSDFMDYLPDSCWVYNKEESLSMIKEAVLKCESMKNQYKQQ